MTRRISSLTGSFYFALLAVSWFLLFIVMPQSLMAADLTIDHVTIVSPERAQPLRDAEVRLHDGRIVSIQGKGAHPPQAGDDAQRIDGTGMFLSPGLIDSHVHLGGIPGMSEDQERAHPEIAAAARHQIPHSYLLAGFTTLIDLISEPESMRRWKSSSDAVPDTYYCGGAALIDGYAMNYDPQPQRYHDWPYMLMEPGMQAPAGIDPAQHTPQAVVSHMQHDGAICVKTFFERGFDGVSHLPVPKAETIRALVRAAHAAGMPVLMHANTDEAHAFALATGVDILAHGLWNWNQEDSNGSKTADITPGIRKILDGELAAHMGWQPTLQVMHGIVDVMDPQLLSDPRLKRVLPQSLIDWYGSAEASGFRESVAKSLNVPVTPDAESFERVKNGPLGLVVARAASTTRYMAEHDGRILFGTDTPSAPTYANAPGLNAWLEMQDLMKAGETPEQIFRSATLTNARALKLDHDIGTVEVGKRANLLLLRRDPSQTIDAYGDIAKVILDGRVLDPAALAANRSH